MEKGVFILGELNVDLIFSAKEIEMEWNKEKLVDRFELVLGSSSAITACHLAGLGEKVYFVSVVGDDQFGEFCIEKLQEKGVDTQFVKKVPTLQTGVTLSLSTQKDRALLTYLGAISELTPEDLPSEIYTQAKHIHFGSFFLQKKMQGSWGLLFSKAKDKGITTSFDTGWDPEQVWHKEEITALLASTDLFIPNEEEALHIFGVQSVEGLMSQLPEKRGLVAVKRGSKGAALITPSDQLLYLKGFHVTPVDTTGAGDAFNAGLITSYLHGKKGEELLKFANACGALATLRLGGASQAITALEVQVLMERKKRAGIPVKENKNAG